MIEAPFCSSESSSSPKPARRGRGPIIARSLADSCHDTARPSRAPESSNQRVRGCPGLRRGVLRGGKDLRGRLLPTAGGGARTRSEKLRGAIVGGRGRWAGCRPRAGIGANRGSELRNAPGHPAGICRRVTAELLAEAWDRHRSMRLQYGRLFEMSAIPSALSAGRPGSRRSSAGAGAVRRPLFPGRGGGDGRREDRRWAGHGHPRSRCSLGWRRIGRQRRRSLVVRSVDEVPRRAGSGRVGLGETLRSAWLASAPRRRRGGVANRSAISG